jgi:hypothetical protein
MAAELLRGDFMARIRAILLSPKKAWGHIALEPADPVGLYLHHILPLAAIPPLAKLIGWSLIFGFIGFGTGLPAALFSYALGLAGVLILAIVAARIARYLHGEDRLGQALTLIAYAATPSWIGGAFRLVPTLGMLSLLASLYSLYLLYLGAPLLLAVPADRALSFTVLIALAALLLFLVFGVLLATFFGLGAFGMV